MIQNRTIISSPIKHYSLLLKKKEKKPIRMEECDKFIIFLNENFEWKTALLELSIKKPVVKIS